MRKNSVGPGCRPRDRTRGPEAGCCPRRALLFAVAAPWDRWRTIFIRRRCGRACPRCSARWRSRWSSGWSRSRFAAAPTPERPLSPASGWSASLYYLELVAHLNAALGGDYSMVRPLPFALAAMVAADRGVARLVAIARLRPYRADAHRSGDPRDPGLADRWLRMAPRGGAAGLRRRPGDGGNAAARPRRRGAPRQPRRRTSITSSSTDTGRRRRLRATTAFASRSAPSSKAAGSTSRATATRTI